MNFHQAVIKRFSFFVFGCTFAFDASAQILKSDTIIVIKDYWPTLADAVKYRTDAPLPTPDTAKQNLAYSTNPSLMKLPYVPATLRPIAMSRETETGPLQNNYVKAGFGTQWSPLLDAHFSNGRNDKLYYALNLFHHSADGADKFKNFAENRLDATIKFPGKKVAAELTGGYDGHAIHYYVYDKSDSVLENASNNALRNRFSAVNVGFAIENSTPTKSGIGYRWSFGDRYFISSRTYSENDIFTNLRIGKTFLEKHTVNIDLGFEYDATNHGDSSTNYWYVPIHPFYEFQQDNFYVRGGFTVVASDSVLFYPDVYGQVKLLEGQVVPFIQASGATVKNYFSRLTEINPWVSENAQQRVGKYIDLRGGVKGSFGGRFAYALNIGYRFHDHLPMFKAMHGPVVTFDVVDPTISDSLNIGVRGYAEDVGELNPHFEIGFRASDKAAITLQGDYHQYRLDFSTPAYGYPDWKLTLSGDYNIGDKILLKADLFALSPTKQLADLQVDSVVNVDGWFDASLEVIYNYKKNFGAFVQLNNITAQKYARWFRYENYGFNAKAGIIVKF